MARKISLNEFASRISFRQEGNTIHGELIFRMPDGTKKKIVAQGSIEDALQRVAAKSPVGWGIPGFDVDDVVDAGKAIVKSSVTKKIYGTAVKLAADPKIQAAVAVTVPGGAAIAVGMKAATMLEKATLGKDPAAKAKIAAITTAAAAGNKTAAKAQAVLKTVYAKGKLKGAWGNTTTKAKPKTTSSKKPSAAPAVAAGLGGLGLLLLLL